MRKRTAASLVLAVILVHFLLPASLVAPLNLFVTFVHEAGHALGALLTGGSVSAIVVDPNGAGYTITSGGIRAVVVASGYLGATLFGVLMLRLNSIPEARSRILEGLAAGILLLAVGYVRDPFTMLYVMAATAVLAWVGLKTNPEVEFHVVSFLAVLVGTGAIQDLRDLVAISAGAGRVMAGGMTGGRTDAEAMEAMTGIPAMAWALAWIALSVVLLLREARRATTGR